MKVKHPEVNKKSVKELRTYLEMKTVGKSRSTVKTHDGEKENGLEAWRVLHEKFEPRAI